MQYRFQTVAILLTVALLAPGLTFGQSQSDSDLDVDPSWEMPRMANGQPDLQGYWTTQTFTPMERPEYLGDKAFYSEEERIISLNPALGGILVAEHLNGAVDLGTEK